MHSAMFGVMEDAQDILREYMLRLLGYKGNGALTATRESGTGKLRS